MFEYFYHEILRKTIISFGTLFNGIVIKKKEDSNDISSLKVPLSYGPTQKFLARLEQSGDLNKSTSITLPRMSFEFTGLTYDGSRKTTTTQKISIKDPDSTSSVNKVYTPVPYNMQFELSIMTKLNDDALQIVEQILPYFQPSYNVSVELIQGISEKRDIPIVLENITMQDDYEGDYSTRRVLLYTLRFTAKTYLFGPVSKVKPIKTATLSYYSSTDTSPENVRELAYTVAPRAIKDYNNSIVATLEGDISISTTTFEVSDVSGIVADSYYEMEGEQIYVKRITGNKLTVRRGEDNTTAIAHVRGTELKSITQEDTNLIEFGDDFGFDGNTF